MTKISVSKLVYHYNLMSTIEKKILETIVPTTTTNIGSNNKNNELLLK